VVPGICKGSGGRDVLKTSSDDNSLVAMIRAGIIPEESKTRRIKEKTARKVEKHWKTSFFWQNQATAIETVQGI